VFQCELQLFNVAESLLFAGGSMRVWRSVSKTASRSA
jgi:hypothetical protein